jgi:hypothetical protein
MQISMPLTYNRASFTEIGTISSNRENPATLGRLFLYGALA